jgi:hypothetical protein
VRLRQGPEAMAEGDQSLEGTAVVEDLSAVTEPVGLEKSGLGLAAVSGMVRRVGGRVGGLGVRVERYHKYERSRIFKNFRKDWKYVPLRHWSLVTGSPQCPGRLKLEPDVMQICLHQLLVLHASLLVNSAGRVRRIFYQTTLL